MKARLIEAGLRFGKTHDLEELLDLVIPVEPLWDSFRSTLNRLNSYAVNFPYPASAKRWLGMLGLPIGETCRGPVPARRADDDETFMLENLRHWIDETRSIGGATR